MPFDQPKRYNSGRSVAGRRGCTKGCLLINLNGIALDEALPIVEAALKDVLQQMQFWLSGQKRLQVTKTNWILHDYNGGVSSKRPKRKALRTAASFFNPTLTA
eukprot:gene21022-32892_t